jgi:hypothetical protein
MTGRPIGTEMSEWLDETLLAAYAMAQQVQAARSQPRQAVEKIEAHMRALKVFEQVASEGGKRRAGEAEPRTPAASPPRPPSSNTGGKGPRSAHKVAQK